MKCPNCRKGLLFALLAGVSIAAATMNSLTSKTIPGAPGVPMPDYNWRTKKPVVKANVNAGPGIVTPAAGVRTPNPPAVVRLNDATIRVTIDPSGNTFSTGFAVQEVKSNKFVQADFTMGDKAVYRTFSQWGGDAGFTLKVPSGTVYLYKVYAKAGGQ